jgi:hypothetical protein
MSISCEYGVHEESTYGSGSHEDVRQIAGEAAFLVGAHGGGESSVQTAGLDAVKRERRRGGEEERGGVEGGEM